MADGHAYKYIADFKCTGDKCPDTCCKNWSMQVNDGHVERYQKSLPEINPFIMQEAGFNVMKRDEQTDVCLKLDNGLCGIQNKFGHDMLGDACYFYPRVTRNIGGVPLQSASLSCPETARLAIYGENPFVISGKYFERMPEGVKEVLAHSVTAENYNHVQRNLLEAIENSTTAIQAMEKLIACIYSFQVFSPDRWAGGISIFLKMAENKLPAPEKDSKDIFHILITTYGLLHAVHKPPRSRLKEVLEKIQERLGVSVDINTLEVLQNRDQEQFPKLLNLAWKKEAEAEMDKVLKRWIQTQIIMHSYPFAGFGNDVRTRTMALIVRFLVTRLGLMAHTGIDGTPPSEEDVIKVIQTISRFIYDLGGPELSIKLYTDLGWNVESRMRGLVQG